MKTKKEIQARIEEIKTDPDFKRPDASKRRDLDLAMKQSDLKAQVASLEWALTGGK